MPSNPVAPLLTPLPQGGGRRREHRSRTMGVASGVPIMQEQFGTNLRLAVEIAWGAVPTADPSTWTWTDVTTDALAAGSITNRQGKANEAATTQPSSLAFKLINTTGKYSKAPQSPNYAVLKRGVPIRMRVIYNGISYQRFLGFSTGFTPSWDVTGKFAAVDVAANGKLRRLSQGSDPLQSTLRRSIPTLSSLVAYWPCEDGQQSPTFASAIGGPSMTISGTPNLASFSKFLASTPIPTLQADTWVGAVYPYMSSGSGQVRFLMFLPSASYGVGDRIASIITSGGVVGRVDLLTGSALGSLRLVVYGGVGGSYGVLLDTGTLGFVITDQLIRMSISWSPSGPDTKFVLSTLVVGGAGGFVTVTVSSSTVGPVSSVVIAPDGTMQGTAIGHIYVQNLQDSIFNLAAQLAAFDGELPTDRIIRLCGEQGEKVAAFGTSSDAMGPQTPDTFLNLLRACELWDGGVLYDRFTNAFGFAYVSRAAKENQQPRMVLDASIGDIAHPVAPTDDDLLTRNEFQASRTNGGSYTATDVTGTYGTQAVGTYSSSATLTAHSDAQLRDYAWWQVHMGTHAEDGYRYPTINIKFEQSPNQLGPWLATAAPGVLGSTNIGDRIDITNLNSVRSQQDPALISLTLEGFSETIDQFLWDVTANTSPYDLWRIATIAAETGDITDTAWRLESDGSSTVGTTAVGATTLLVAVPSGPLWTTAVDDFPLNLDVAGWEVVATAVLGVSSPQTFTIQPAPAVLPSGSAVTVWRQAVPDR